MITYILLSLIVNTFADTILDFSDCGLCDNDVVIAETPNTPFLAYFAFIIAGISAMSVLSIYIFYTCRNIKKD